MKPPINPTEIVEKFFNGATHMHLGKHYHSALPEDLCLWYCYTLDGGHSILALIEGHFDENNPELWNEMCPCPVKSVLRNYRILKGFPVVPLQYDDTFGLVTEPKDDEYE